MLKKEGYIHRRPNRVLWGLHNFPTEAIYAAAAVAAAVYNRNVKTAFLFL